MGDKHLGEGQKVIVVLVDIESLQVNQLERNVGTHLAAPESAETAVASIDSEVDDALLLVLGVDKVPRVESRVGKGSLVDDILDQVQHLVVVVTDESEVGRDDMVGVLEEACGQKYGLEIWKKKNV